jgi:hypothetical protein
MRQVARDQGRLLPFLLLLALSLVSGLGARAADPIDVQVVVVSSGSGPDEVSVVYAAPAGKAKQQHSLEAQARRDFLQLAAAFGQLSLVKVSTAAVAKQVAPTTSAEGKLHRLVNRPAGWLNIGPFLKVFSRYDRLSLTFFVLPPFQFHGPRGPFDDPTLAMTLDIGGNAYTYNVRLKHAGGVDAALPAFEAPPRGLARLGRFAYLLVALMAAAVGVAVYALLQLWLGRKGTVKEAR